MGLAEVASTFFEDLVMEKVAEDLSDEEKKLLQIQRIDNIMASIQRQVACYKFEQDLHTEFRKL